MIWLASLLDSSSRDSMPAAAILMKLREDDFIMPWKAESISKSGAARWQIGIISSPAKGAPPHARTRALLMRDASAMTFSNGGALTSAYLVYFVMALPRCRPR